MIAIIEYIFACLLELVFHKPTEKKQYVLLVSLFLVGLINIYYYPYIVLLYLYIMYAYIHYQFLKTEKLFWGLLTLLFGLNVFVCVYLDSVIYTVFGFLVFVILEYIQVRILQREEDKTIIYQNKLLKQQMDEIETIYMTMRGWRHDYHNHLQSLKGYLKLEQIDQIKNYLDELEEDLKSIDTLYHSGNLQIDAILNSKLAIAENDGIHLTCDAEVPPALTVSEIDLCVIIGNLLDNAIESCRKIENKEERFIRVYIGILKQQLYISITNTTSESVRQRTDTYFSNKRGDHGHGLRRVDNVVKKYDGYVNRQNEPGVFATEIMLPL
ncbi:MAG: GHKL domain-containing protein [Erysipelotrichales bacterium]|nr:GHKL domain-containing protein [Erysipelotrichales bacterium]